MALIQEKSGGAEYLRPCFFQLSPTIETIVRPSNYAPRETDSPKLEHMRNRYPAVGTTFATWRTQRNWT